MERNDAKLSKKHKKQLFKNFLISAGITLTICLVMVIGAFVFYDNTLGAQSSSEVNIELTDEELMFEEEKSAMGELNKTIAVFGVDADDVRTDVIFVVNFNTITNKVKVVSIPRDTKVVWSDKQNRALSQLTGNTRSVSKLNEMAAYGRINQNIGNIRDFTIDELENILRVHIDNYVVIDLKAFAAIVEAIDGVDMYVPQRMYYTDRSQGLYIDLYEGMQHLDAAKAEQLVRFRSYPLGDEARVAVQQSFLTAVAQKVLSTETISKLPAIVTKVFPYIKTDVKLTEVMGYLQLLDQFDLKNLEMHTVPGYGDDYEGPSYYYIDETALDELIIDVFYDTTVAEDDEVADRNDVEDIVEDRTVSVAIYNATGEKGVAGRYKNQLESIGYNIVKIDNYSESNLKNSIIYAKDKSKAAQFLEHVSGATIQQKSDIDYDIVIIIGSKSLTE